ncbi:hypothetical protein SD80_011685 [Scytonema tolypothrichoides VB-61278]|nr:hypothetical protein SD80_011685 [Scytonema tolypothrichoides VB-61278]
MALVSLNPLQVRTVQQHSTRRCIKVPRLAINSNRIDQDAAQVIANRPTIKTTASASWDWGCSACCPLNEAGAISKVSNVGQDTTGYSVRCNINVPVPTIRCDGPPKLGRSI